MDPVEPGFYVGARLAQINRKSFQYGKAGPQRQMNPPREHRHARRGPEQVLAQRRWTAPAQDGGYLLACASGAVSRTAAIRVKSGASREKCCFRLNYEQSGLTIPILRVSGRTIER